MGSGCAWPSRALVKESVLLIADEPTARLDTETRKAVLEFILRAASSGTAILLATHDEAVVEVADRVLAMEDGRYASRDARAALVIRYRSRWPLAADPGRQSKLM